VIIGQQRLTTLQIFLSALRDFFREHGCDELAKEFDGYTLNWGTMANPEVDKLSTHLRANRRFLGESSRG
jgi:hypothetical protein